MTDLVFMQNNQVVTSSRYVARDFAREHRSVLRDIDNLIQVGGAQNCADLFYETTYIHEQNKQKYREYLMNRDGFTLLVMGFTGKKAIKFKINYIQAFNEMEKRLQQPKTQLEVLQQSINQLVEQEREIKVLKQGMKTTNEKVDNFSEILALNPTQWRKKVNAIINKIAQKQGGAYQDVRNDSYQLLEERARCQLSIRKTNKQRKMALEGVPKSKIDKVNKMDVIADDARLTEIYLAVVKELAIKNNIDIERRENT